MKVTTVTLNFCKTHFGKTHSSLEPAFTSNKFYTAIKLFKLFLVKKKTFDVRNLTIESDKADAIALNIQDNV